MDYLGSKLRLREFIVNAIESTTNNNFTTFAELFAGTGIIAQYYKAHQKQIIVNDLQYYSYVLNRHFIVTNSTPLFSSLPTSDPFAFLNALSPNSGFIYRHYSTDHTSKTPHSRLYFTPTNAGRIDAIRSQLEQWRTEKLLSDDDYFYLLASLLEAADRVSNTASVYAAYLKQYKSSSKAPLVLRPLPIIPSTFSHQAFNLDANQLISQISPDVLYLDPPYNHRQYSTNYHLLETIARYDRPILRGKTGLRPFLSQRSLYSLRSMAAKTFTELIANSTARYIFVSYNNEGLLSPTFIAETLRTKGRYSCITTSYSRFKADSSRPQRATSTTEYLHIADCT